MFGNDGSIDALVFLFEVKVHAYGTRGLVASDLRISLQCISVRLIVDDPFVKNSDETGLTLKFWGHVYAL